MKIRFYCCLLVVFYCLIGSVHAQYVEKDKRQNKKDSTVTNKTETNTNNQGNQTKTTQNKSNAKDKMSLGERFTFGGNLGGQIAGNPIFFDVSPIVGYRASERFTIGVGGTYMFYSYKSGTYTNSTSIYAGRYFGMYAFVPQIFAYAEHEFMNTQYFDQVDFTFKRRWLSSPLIGIGFRQPIGGRASFNVIALYNLNYQKEYSPYGSPLVLRFGAMF